MTKQHPITPPPELVRQWIPAGWDCSPNTFTTLLMRIADNAALWSHDHCKSKIKAATDQELEACCELTRDNEGYDAALRLRAARRPKPPSRKEQALEAISRLCASVIHDDLKDDAAIVLLALEDLDD